MTARRRFARAQSDAIKGRLRAETEEAQRLGIFGAPSFIANGELFWGNDRLEQALDHASAADADCHGSDVSMKLGTTAGSA